MVKVKENLIGKIFGTLTVVGQADDYILPCGKHFAQWQCICECGNSVIKTQQDLKRIKNISCGCTRTNKYDLSGDYGVGYTTDGKEFYFDIEDYEKIKKYTWSYDDRSYIVGYLQGKFERMHRVIMNASNGEIVDHINHIHFDNRKVNLRIVTRSQNNMNSTTPKNNRSGVTGVYYDKKGCYWVGQIEKDYKILTKCFKDKQDAVAWRKAKEQELFGEYACNVVQNNTKEFKEN